VLERIVAGRLNKQIADDLGISIKTVEAHRANIMEKLNVNTVADLLRLALSRNSWSRLAAPSPRRGGKELACRLPTERRLPVSWPLVTSPSDSPRP
jgi:hypothetical protein